MTVARKFYRVGVGMLCALMLSGTPTMAQPPGLTNFRAPMRDIVVTLSAYAKGRKPGFIILLRGDIDLFAKSQREIALEELADPAGNAKSRQLPLGSLMSRFTHATDALVLDDRYCSTDALAQEAALAAERDAAREEAKKKAAAEKKTQQAKARHKPMAPTAANRIERLKPLPPGAEQEHEPGGPAAPPLPPLNKPAAAAAENSEAPPSKPGALLTEAMSASARANADREAAVRKARRDLLAVIRDQGIRVFDIDHCPDTAHQKQALRKAAAEQVIAFVDTDQKGALDRLPTGRPWAEDALNVGSLRDVKNALVLLDSRRYLPKEEYLARLGDNNYDLLIIDGFYKDNQALTADEIYRLQFKRLGAKRLVIARLHLGQARDTKSYWKDDWRIGMPEWLDAPTPDKPGVIDVQYWNEAWKKLVGQYFKGLMDLGVDGIMLEGIDSYALFEARQPIE